MKRATSLKLFAQRQYTRAIGPARRTLLARPYGVLEEPLNKKHELSQREERPSQIDLQADAGLEDEEEDSGIEEDWRAMHEPISGKGRLNPGIVQPEELKKDPKMHELPIF